MFEWLLIANSLQHYIFKQNPVIILLNGLSSIQNSSSITDHRHVKGLSEQGCIVFLWVKVNYTSETKYYENTMKKSVFSQCSCFFLFNWHLLLDLCIKEPLEGCFKLVDAFQGSF